MSNKEVSLLTTTSSFVSSFISSFIPSLIPSSVIQSISSLSLSLSISSSLTLSSLSYSMLMFVSSATSFWLLTSRRLFLTSNHHINHHKHIHSHKHMQSIGNSIGQSIGHYISNNNINNGNNNDRRGIHSSSTSNNNNNSINGSNSINNASNDSSSSDSIVNDKVILKQHYHHLLSQLFAYSPKPSRHVTNDVMSSRFAYFNQQWRQYYPHHHNHNNHSSNSSNNVSNIVSNNVYGNDNRHVIHIAGTKGKGSTVEYINAGLISNHQRVGVFTSPHLHTARERIKIGKQLISVSDFLRIGNRVLESMQTLSWTVFFDLLLSMAINYFGEKDVDYIILETGIGGRYDSTNFLDKIGIAVLTSISLDHQAVLGNTIEEIAWQKAGIIKKGCHVFTSAQQPASVLQVFREECSRQEAILHEVVIDRNAAIDIDPSARFDSQFENICVSAAVLKHLNMNTDGMRGFYWPCRMENFHLGPLDVIIDGAHNEHSVRLLLKGVRQNFPSRRVVALFGAGAEKCVNDMLATVHTFADEIIFAKSSHFKSLPVEELTKMYHSVLQQDSGSQQSKIMATDALQTVSDLSVYGRLNKLSQAFSTQENGSCAETVPVIVIFGSLFVAADAREEIFRLDPTQFKHADWVRESDNFE